MAAQPARMPQKARSTAGEGKLPRVSERQEQAKRSKFGAVRTEVDGVTFASKAEARRYSELRLLEKAGEIAQLELQPVFRLCVVEVNGGAKAGVVGVQDVGAYVADFRYRTSHGAVVVEDVKGFSTPLYKWKKKHVEAQYGITVVEIR